LRLFRETLENRLRRLRKGDFRFHIPGPREKMRRNDGTHFHFSPELFLQLEGATEFIFPREKIRLAAGETLLVPRGMPHGEIAHDSEKDFLNVVVMFPPDGVSIHDALKDKQGKPHCFYQEYFRTEKGRRIEQYLDDIADFHRPGGKAGKTAGAGEAVQGLFQAALAGLLLIMEEVKTPAPAAGHPKIDECRKYILSHIYECSLSVRELAGQIHCSPDYLSHLFVTETGERLSDFIHRERIVLAKRYLQNQTLSIKETAWACGFTDQGYFSRLFKSLAGETPKEFRKHHKM